MWGAFLMTVPDRWPACGEGAADGGAGQVPWTAGTGRVPWPVGQPEIATGKSTCSLRLPWSRLTRKVQRPGIIRCTDVE
ncbi:hypothetical protein TPA0905_50940 [Streptomyces olivaceus]|nr:hypothetical protein TPA0905_50940 [Streptomyces olivaceus]